jgi:cyclic pyranopterin phosphate synthase
MAPVPPLDRFRRPLQNLRLSVTDRCNLRCSYCMPAEEYVWLPRADILSFEELAHLARVFVSLGVEKLRLTGGEPLLRRDLHVLVRQLAGLPGLRDLALTTNGILLEEQAAELCAAGLTRLTVSLDTLSPERFRALARRDEHARVLAGLAAARAAGFTGTKLNTVVLRGVNDDELVALLEFASAHGCEVRFIEYMDVGGATEWRGDTVVSRAEIRARLAAHYGPIVPDPADDPAAPAERFLLPDGTRFGIIASTTEPFCATCDRARLTADGVFYTCLYAPAGTALRPALRAGASDEELAARILGLWRERTDRGAEERLALAEHRRASEPSDLRSNPHLEMHTRGG